VTYPMRPKERRKATACVELAVLLPLLMALFLFATDFARVLYYTITIENCALNGALFGGQGFDNQNQQWIGNQQYWQGPNGQVVSLEKAVAELDGTNLNPALADSNVTVSSGTDANGNPVNIVTVKYTFSTIVSYPGIPSPLTIVRTAQARVAPPTPK
jgi:TadE-like protein